MSLLVLTSHYVVITRPMIRTAVRLDDKYVDSSVGRTIGEGVILDRYVTGSSPVPRTKSYPKLYATTWDS